MAVDEASRESEIVVEHRSLPLCLDLTPSGELWLVSSTEWALLRRTLDGGLERIADLRAEGSHPWNDIVINGRGNAYVKYRSYYQLRVPLHRPTRK